MIFREVQEGSEMWTGTRVGWRFPKPVQLNYVRVRGLDYSFSRVLLSCVTLVLRSSPRRNRVDRDEGIGKDYFGSLVL